MIRIKIIDIIRDKNVNLYSLHLYFSIVEELICKKYIFIKFSELFLMEKGGVACLYIR
jgi:hypothetical protein